MDKKALEKRPIAERLLRKQLEGVQRMLTERDDEINRYAEAAIRREKKIISLSSENSRLIREVNDLRIASFVG